VSWFWMNIPLAAVFFAAMVGIPLWIVFKHPDTRVAADVREAEALAARAERAVRDHFPQTQPVVLAVAPARHARARLTWQTASARGPA